MSVKTRRIEMRADEASEGRIAAAAGLLGQSISAFVLSAANREADLVLARRELTFMPAEQFDRLIASLDVADEAQRLRAVAARPRRFRRA